MTQYIGFILKYTTNQPKETWTYTNGGINIRGAPLYYTQGDSGWQVSTHISGNKNYFVTWCDVLAHLYFHWGGIKCCYKYVTNVDDIGYPLRVTTKKKKKVLFNTNDITKKFDFVCYKPQKKPLYISEDTILKYIT